VKGEQPSAAPGHVTPAAALTEVECYDLCLGAAALQFRGSKYTCYWARYPYRIAINKMWDLFQHFIPTVSQKIGEASNTCAWFDTPAVASTEMVVF